MTGCPSTSARHDRATDYTNHGCRCPAARADRERRRKRGHLDGPMHVPAIGARRRLRALMRIGWSQNDINQRIGRSRSGSLGPLLWTDRPTVHVDVDQRIRGVYDQLWRTPGPSKVTANRAKAKGWPPPLFWDDDLIDHLTHPAPSAQPQHWSDIDPVAVARAKAGHQVSLTRAERISAVLELDEEQISHREIGRRLHVDSRQVLRDLADHRDRIAS